MQNWVRRLGREVTAAGAVLTLYLLTLLVPLHQAQATQDNFQTLGYEKLSGWSLCIGGDYEPAESEKLPTACPFAGIGKISIAPALISGAGFDHGAAFEAIAYPAQDTALSGRFHADAHPPRAPPVLL